MESIGLDPDKLLAEALTLLGKGNTQYVFNQPTPELLETFPSPKEHPYQVELVSKEFTSLCPKTAQPDFADISILYTPKEKCVETKSLKLYLFSYRNYGAFMEAITNRIAEDLVRAMQPRQLRVVSEFHARGGITTLVVVNYEEGKGFFA